MTTITLRRTAGATAALVAAGALSLAAFGPAHAATHAHAADRASKKFTFVTGASTLNGKESSQVGLFHGAINGGGKDKPLAQSDVAYLPDGTITVEHPDKASTFTPQVDKKTCYITFKTTGSFTLDKGTGAYQGISGSGTYVGYGYGYTTKKKDGTCNLNAEPQSEVFQITGKGTLS